MAGRDLLLRVLMKILIKTFKTTELQKHEGNMTFMQQLKIGGIS